MSDPSKPALPESYVTPAVWAPNEKSASFGGMNKPTAAPRHKKPLSKGAHPLQLYSLGTPNGQKVTILLEELGVDYDAWKISIMGEQGDQFGEEFTKVNPNQKIPALLDYSVDAQKPLRVFESGSILVYLADKYKRFIPQDVRGRTECLNWVFWNIGTAPFIGGGFGHFYHYAPIRIEYAIDRYAMEAKRILDVLERHLAEGNKQFVVGDEFTIADMAIVPWVSALNMQNAAYKARAFLSMESYTHIQGWIGRIEARPGYKRGMRVNGFSANAVVERHSPADFNEPRL